MFNLINQCDGAPPKPKDNEESTSTRGQETSSGGDINSEIKSTDRGYSPIQRNSEMISERGLYSPIQRDSLTLRETNRDNTPIQRDRTMFGRTIGVYSHPRGDSAILNESDEASGAYSPIRRDSELFSEIESRVYSPVRRDSILLSEIGKFNLGTIKLPQNKI